MATRFGGAARAVRNALGSSPTAAPVAVSQPPAFPASSVVPVQRPMPVARQPLALKPDAIRPANGLLDTAPSRDMGAFRTGFRSAVDGWKAARPNFNGADPAALKTAMRDWRGQRPRFQDYFSRFWNNPNGGA